MTRKTWKIHGNMIRKTLKHDGEKKQKKLWKMTWKKTWEKG
jgi:hypothetical protein